MPVLGALCFLSSGRSQIPWYDEEDLGTGIGRVNFLICEIVIMKTKLSDI